ncbi:ABC transporter substrate-binding protein [Bradyrhizobium sp. CCGB12]|uniref:ABC transporter substrate-binding protein n=1 Tax=Bradyrhizobium sp. CCGB12 TaxID=2949632 RepID=UPI0020B344BE|nr:ABC transporter substrate-binding protein [Bradyrhizobium sp. CCGB12]MCP3390850.1 ABC transporter substrate-binding protein [Bradyrhizobium sp. CCGB12]
MSVAMSRWVNAQRQSPRVRPLVVWLISFTPRKMAGVSFFEIFTQTMQTYGYVNGRNFDLIMRSAEGVLERLPAIVQEVVDLKPAVIVAGATLEAVALRKATSTIPIVCPALADAIHLGLIESESRPGGNVTGIEPYIAGLPAKQIELARELIPDARKLGLLTNQEDPKGPPQATELEAVGKAVGLTMVVANASSRDNIEGALQALAGEKVDVAIVLQTNLLILNNELIAKSSLEKQLATVYGYRENVVAGGLVSYGVDLRWCFRHAAYFVDRILRGASPDNLPIEFPTGFWLAVNVRTAKALGIVVPASMLARADEIVE